jgi:hypothetical protein
MTAVPSSSSVEGWLGLSFGQATLAICAVHAVLGLLMYEPTLFPGGDNANYMILGESLRSGAGYRDLYLPGQPLHAKYPPFFPALLAILGWLGGVQILKLAMLACTTAAVWLTAQIGRGLVGARTALLPASLLALNPVLLEYSHYVLSEAPFLALVLLALWAVERPGRVAFGVAVAAATGAFLTRTAGLTLLIAIPLAAASTRRGWRAATAGASGLAAMLAWALYQKGAAPDQAGYLQELLLRDPYDPAAGTIGFSGLFARAAGNAWTYVSTVLPETLTGLGAAGAPTLATLIGLALAALVLLGWVGRAQKRVGAAEWFVLLYGGLICVWPEVWTDRRFLLPLAPLLLLFAVSGGRGLGERLVSRSGRWATGAVTAVIAAVIAIPSLAFVAGRVPTRVECVSLYRVGDPCDLPGLASLYDAARWARDNTEPDAVIANRKPSLFFWYARRRGDLYRFSTDTDAVIRGLEEMGADYVLVDQVSGTTPRYLVPAIQAHRARFEPVYQGGDPPSVLLRFLQAPTTAARSGLGPQVSVGAGTGVEAP